MNAGLVDTAQSLNEIHALLRTYFDGLHYSDTDALANVFHPEAIYATASEGTLTRLDMATYFPIVTQRESPASRGQARTESIVSIEFAGPVTALARVTCTIVPKQFTDLLTLIRLDGRWHIIAKVFHFDLADHQPLTHTATTGA